MERAASRTRQLLVGSTIAVLLLGCTAGTGTPSSATGTASATASVPTASMPTASLPTPAASPSPSVIETKDIEYGAPGTGTEPELLDVYAPTKPGPWPVVVMFHGGGPVSKASYGLQASHVAEQGFVVFVPNWGTSFRVPSPAEFRAFVSEGACSVAFARRHAADYGGDPAALILFGHSAGANLAGSIAFTHPAPTPGCPSGATLEPTHTLVTWDGDWTLTDPSWDDELQADASASWNTYTPISHIASDPTLKVVILASGVVGAYTRDLRDPTVATSFFKVRGPSGLLQRQLKDIGALDDQAYDIQEIQRVFYTVLKAQGNPVTLTALPGTSHDMFGAAMDDKAMAVFVGAFEAAAGG